MTDHGRYDLEAALTPQTAILAGGLGTRLRPLTSGRPKSMVEVMGKPFLQHQIELLRGQGLTRFVLCVGHEADQIVSHFADVDALYDALASGHLRGAMLETFAVEPIEPSSPLLRLENVTLTPHIAGASRRTVKYAASLVAQEVRRYLADEPPLNPC